MRFLVLIALLASTASADAPTSASQMHTDDCARATAAHRTCVIRYWHSRTSAQAGCLSTQSACFWTFARLS